MPGRWELQVLGRHIAVQATVRRKERREGGREEEGRKGHTEEQC